MTQPIWLTEAWRELGQRERAGAADNARIMKLYRDAGHPGVAHDEVPWCAAFVGACLTRSGLASTRSLMARSYAKFGAALDEARLGAIAVLSRGGDPSLGHVGFVVGWTDQVLMLLGGNQGDAVSVAPFERSRLVALRWPDDRPRAVEQPNDHAVPARTTDAAFDRALAHVLEMEGGFTDDPHDPGGPTNKGILLRELAEWKGVTLDALNTPTFLAELKSISHETISAIYRQRYWQPGRCADMPAGLALMHFDAAVNQGVGTAARMLQEAVGTDVDGEIGPQTRAAIAHNPLQKTLATYADIRRRRYRALPHFWRFGRGWLNRVDVTLRRALGESSLSTRGNEINSQGETEMAKVIEKQPEAKWWGRSMTIWGVVVTALSTVMPALAPLIGVDLPGDLVREAGGQVVTTVQAIGGLVGVVMSILGRLRASQPLERRALSLKL